MESDVVLEFYDAEHGYSLVLFVVLLFCFVFFFAAGITLQKSGNRDRHVPGHVLYDVGRQSQFSAIINPQHWPAISNN